MTNSRSVTRTIRPFYATSRDSSYPCAFFEDEVSFDWHMGMSWRVRQRSSDSLHEAILEKYGERANLSEDQILEVSTASHDYEVGGKLSALNLTLFDDFSGEYLPVENVFQSSKVFEKNGKTFGPFYELRSVSNPKRYISQNRSPKTTGSSYEDELFKDIQSEVQGATMCGFILHGKEYPLIPRSAFYDYVYVSALSQEHNRHLAEQLINYRIFTDIMFNPGKGKNKKYNTQARSCAIFSYLYRTDLVRELTEPSSGVEDFINAVSYPPEGTSPQNRLLI